MIEYMTVITNNLIEKAWTSASRYEKYSVGVCRSYSCDYVHLPLWTPLVGNSVSTRLTYGRKNLICLHVACSLRGMELRKRGSQWILFS